VGGLVVTNFDPRPCWYRHLIVRYLLGTTCLILWSHMKTRCTIGSLMAFLLGHCWWMHALSTICKNRLRHEHDLASTKLETPGQCSRQRWGMADLLANARLFLERRELLSLVPVQPQAGQPPAASTTPWRRAVEYLQRLQDLQRPYEDLWAWAAATERRVMTEKRGLQGCWTSAVSCHIWSAVAG